jgi:hypothetical protein
MESVFEDIAKSLLDNEASDVIPVEVSYLVYLLFDI